MADKSAPWEDFKTSDAAPWEDFAEERGGSTNANPYRIEVRGTSADEDKPSFGGDIDSAVGAVSAQNLGPHSEKSLRDTLVDAAGRIGQGFAGGANLLGEKLTDIGNRVLPTDSPMVAENTESVKREADAYRQQRPSLGLPGALGEMGPELLLTGGPIASAGKSMLPLSTRLIGKRAAPLVSDVTANAGYSAAKSAAEGNGITDIMKDAAMGAGGAAAGRAVGNVTGRALGGITADAAQLMKAGITPTYGQAFGNDGIVAAAERALSKFPLAGAAVDRAKGRAIRQYSEAEIDQALKNTGIPHEGSGYKAVKQINDTIHAGYEDVKANTFLAPQDANQAVVRAAQAIKDIPLLTDAQQGSVVSYYQQKIVPELQKAQRAGTAIDGETAQKINVELGNLARSHANSSNPADHPLGQAFYTLQSSLRSALKSNDPAVLQQLQVLNGAYQRMLPINLATERATATKGGFTPNQFRSAATQSKVPSYDPRLNLNDAARETLNGPATGLSSSLSRNLGVPGVAGGLSFGAHQLGIPAEAIAAANAAVVLGGTGVAHALYSEPGIRLMLGAMNLIPSTAKWVFAQTPQRQQEFVLRMMAEHPDGMKKIAAQVGRALATQGENP
ncbi:hypothetical protein WKW80_26930 [Variovorax humicola]|uniref:Uncharacterized protein n=1 Tax=Variovorax humicola TaxID=1769758 RepID=A0ABU8W7X5_9BURK